MYCLIAVVLVPGAAAFLGAGARYLLGNDYWHSWQPWFLGNALTQLVITPAILYGIPGAARAVKSARPKRWIEALLVTIGLIGAGYIAFQAPPSAGGFAEPQFYAPVPFLFWAALRFGIPGASGAVAIIAIISVEAALRGHGPFAGRSPGDTALALQEFLLLRAAPLYLVGILVEEKEASDAGLIQSERRYREVVESQTELVCRFLVNGKLSFVSETFCRAFQREREVLLGSDFMTLMSASARETARAQITFAALHGEQGEWECQVPLRGGNVGWQHWVCHAVAGTDSDATELQAIGRDITDRKRAEDADRSLSGKLIEAQERERSRIARDLHDDVNQRLAAASIELSAIRRHAIDERGRTEIDHLQEELIALSEEVRHISHNLHPSLLHHTGLSTALGALCSSQRHRNGPSIDLRVPTDTDNLPPEIALCLYRVAQEALANAIRHAKASHVEMELQVGVEHAELSVRDNGIGLIAQNEERHSRGLGLFSLDERAKLLGGTFELTTAVGHGVRVCIRIPIRH